MGRVRTATLWLSVLAGSIACAVGCTPGKQSVPPVASPPPTTGGDKAPPALEGAFVRGRGRGATEAAAYQAARLDLATVLLGDPTWLDVIEVDIHSQARDGYAAGTQEGQSVVHVGLDESRAAGLLAEFEYTKPKVVAPEPWRDVLYEAIAAHGALLACQRRELLFGVKCDGSSTEAQDQQMAATAKGISFEARIRDGAPVDGEGRLLRAASVRVLWQGAPLAGVPVSIRTPQRPAASVTSAADGSVTVPVDVGAAWPGPAVLTLDAAAVAGPLAALWSASEVIVDARALEPRRWTLVLEGDTPAGGAFAKKLQADLGALLGPPVSLPKRRAVALARAGVAERARLLTATADDMAGALDVVVFATADARFASRAGGSRVWFEGKGAVSIYEAWGAGQLGTKAAEATASGVGDKRAGDAVGNQLAEALVEHVRAVLKASAGSGSVSQR